MAATAALVVCLRLHGVTGMRTSEQHQRHRRLALAHANHQRDLEEDPRKECGEGDKSCHDGSMSYLRAPELTRFANPNIFSTAAEGHLGATR